MGLKKIAEGVYLQKYPLKLLGCNIGRSVTVLKLSDGKSLIHSSAPFSESDIAGFRQIGEPSALIEATNFHDTFTAKARDVLPDVSFYVPEGFPLKGIEVSTIPPKEWSDEIVIIPIKGIPKLAEHAVYHRASRTLIVADLLFNLQPGYGKWTLLFMRIMSGMKEYPARSRLFNLCIADKDAFRESIQEIAELDFERIIVGHGEPITRDAKALFKKAFGVV